MRLLCAILVLLTACGGPPEWPGNPSLYGVDLVIVHDIGSRFVDNEDFTERLKRTLYDSAIYMGHDPRELAGLRLEIRGEDYVIDPARPWLIGLYAHDAKTIIVKTVSMGADCQEDMMVPHELAHYFAHGDANHTSVAFTPGYFAKLWETMHANVGAACAPSVYADQWGNHSH